MQLAFTSDASSWNHLEINAETAQQIENHDLLKMFLMLFLLFLVRVVLVVFGVVLVVVVYLLFLLLWYILVFVVDVLTSSCNCLSV